MNIPLLQGWGTRNTGTENTRQDGSTDIPGDPRDVKAPSTAGCPYHAVMGVLGKLTGRPTAAAAPSIGQPAVDVAPGLPAAASQCPFLASQNLAGPPTAAAALTTTGTASQTPFIEPRKVGFQNLWGIWKVADKLVGMHDKFGPVFTMNTHTKFGKLLFTSRTPDIQQILTNTDRGDNSWTKTDLFFNGFKTLIGNDQNVLWGSGGNWEKTHEVMRPFMNGRAMNNDSMSSALDPILMKHINDIKSRVRANGGELRIELREELQNTTLDVALQTMTGVKISDPNLLEAHHAFRTYAEWILKETIHRGNHSLADAMGGKIPTSGHLKEAYDTLFSLADAIIAKHCPDRAKADPAIAAAAKKWDMERSPAAVHSFTDQESGDDMIDALGKAIDPDTGKPFTNERLRNEVLTLLFAGHETTTAALGWTLTEMANNPTQYAQMKADADKVPKHPDFKEVSRTSDSFTRKSMDETLRKYPSVYALMREATQDTVLGPEGAQVKIPKGTVVVLSMVAASRSEQHWGVEDEHGVHHSGSEFYPERSEVMKAQHPGQKDYPFGGGNRVCLGQHLARLEYQMMLTDFAQAFDIVPEHKNLAMKSEIAIHPQDSFITIRERQPQAAETASATAS